MFPRVGGVALLFGVSVAPGAATVEVSELVYTPEGAPRASPPSTAVPVMPAAPAATMRGRGSGRGGRAGGRGGTHWHLVYE